MLARPVEPSLARKPRVRRRPSVSQRAWENLIRACRAQDRVGPVALGQVVQVHPDHGVSLGDTLLATRVSGSSDGKVVSIVIDPISTTGDSY